MAGARQPTGARTAVAVLVQQAAVAAGAPEPDGALESSILGEVRASLRGCTADGLAATLGSDAPRVESTLAALAARGALAKRGTRWFMA